MPHYANGELAQIGDIVAGKGYNEPQPVTGIVVGVVEGSESCNLRVAYLKSAPVRPADPSSTYDSAKPTGHVIGYGSHCVVVDSVPLIVGMEYGDTKGFTKIHDANQVCDKAPAEQEVAKSLELVGV